MGIGRRVVGLGGMGMAGAGLLVSVGLPGAPAGAAASATSIAAAFAAARASDAATAATLGLPGATSAAATTPLVVTPMTVEPINTQFAVPETDGCTAVTMFGNFGGAAYGKAEITNNDGCGVVVTVTADQSGTIVNGPAVGTLSTWTWAQSAVNPADVIGETVDLCGIDSCATYIYTAF